MRFCLAIGVEHPDFLRMGSRRFADWIAWNRIEAFGEERADLRMGIICSNILAPHMKKGRKPPSPLDLMPYRVKPVPTHAEIGRIIDLAKYRVKRSDERRGR